MQNLLMVGLMDVVVTVAEQHLTVWGFERHVLEVG
jgi:hypothetical protein